MPAIFRPAGARPGVYGTGLAGGKPCAMAERVGGLARRAALEGVPAIVSGRVGLERGHGRKGGGDGVEPRGVKSARVVGRGVVQPAQF